MFFKPKIIDCFEGYNQNRFIRDIFAGITVGIVALPLAMAFAIASGLKPEAGIFTAIIAGSVISLLGGSRVQIGGPAGAFIIIVFGIVERFGVANLLLATAMSGIFLFLMGLFRLGTLVRFIPIAVIIGFTNGIAVLIGMTQVKDFFGLSIEKVPASFFDLMQVLFHAANTINPAAIFISLGCLALLIAWKQLQTRIAFCSYLPGTVIAMGCATLITAILSLPIETIGSRFGSIPASLPQFEWIPITWSSAQFMIVPALTLAVLGAIESLICARIADGLIQDRHKPNQELMAQGCANFITPFFGGMPATGTIARTVTNVHSGATTPISGLVHALTLLLFVLLAAPLAVNIPLASLAAILIYIAWNMGEWRKLVDLKQFKLPYRVTLLSVFILTIVVDLTVAFQVGLILAFITFIYRISNLSRCEPASSSLYPELELHVGSISAYRLYGALFFGGIRILDTIENQLPNNALVLDMKNVIYIDSSGIDAIADLHKQCTSSGITMIVCGLSHQPLETLKQSGLLTRISPECIGDDLQAGISTALEQIMRSGNTKAALQ
jgi:SulP family sulfate permease